MRIAALSVGVAVLVLMLGPIDGRVRQAAQLQFMQGMATFACATFMNIGAHRARHAPAFFLAGSLLYALPAYLPRAGTGALLDVAGGGGAGLVAAGWLVLIVSASSIDCESLCVMGAKERD